MCKKKEDWNRGNYKWFTWYHIIEISPIKGEIIKKGKKLGDSNSKENERSRDVISIKRKDTWRRMTSRERIDLKINVTTYPHVLKPN